MVIVLRHPSREYLRKNEKKKRISNDRWCFPALFSRIIFDLVVRIAVSPQIAPISFGEEPVNAGDLVSVQCVVTKGDFPLEITWTFDGRPIRPYHSDVIVTDSGKRVKQLTIDSVAARHAGEYTCVASNAAGSVSHSATLDVNGITTFRVMSVPAICIVFFFFSDISFTFNLYFSFSSNHTPHMRIFPSRSNSLYTFYLTSAQPVSSLCVLYRSTTCVCVL